MAEDKPQNSCINMCTLGKNHTICEMDGRIFCEDPELLLARQALTLQGAQQVLAILRGKKLTLGQTLMLHVISNDVDTYVFNLFEVASTKRFYPFFEVELRWQRCDEFGLFVLGFVSRIDIYVTRPKDSKGLPFVQSVSGSKIGPGGDLIFKQTGLSGKWIREKYIKDTCKHVQFACKAANTLLRYFCGVAKTKMCVFFFFDTISTSSRLASVPQDPCWMVCHPCGRSTHQRREGGEDQDDVARCTSRGVIAT